MQNRMPLQSMHVQIYAVCTRRRPNWSRNLVTPKFHLQEHMNPYERTAVQTRESVRFSSAQPWQSVQSHQSFGMLPGLIGSIGLFYFTTLLPSVPLEFGGGDEGSGVPLHGLSDRELAA